MSSGRVLRGGLPSVDPGKRVLLRASSTAAPSDPVPAGTWISEQELAALKQQARELGRAEGLRQAQETAQQRADADARARLERELKVRDEQSAKEQAEKWRSLATALAGQMQALRAQLEAEVSEWTFIAVARLMGQHSRESVIASVQHVLSEAGLEGALTVLLNPQDLSLVEAARETDVAGWPDDLRFAASDRLSLGGCVLQAPGQTLDARFEVQLTLLRDALDAARHQRTEQAI